VVDLCDDLSDGVFNMEITPADILKMCRLGRPVEGTSVRPLVGFFKSEEIQSEIMSRLRNLREASTRFKGIEVAHDLTPRELMR